MRKSYKLFIFTVFFVSIITVIRIVRIGSPKYVEHGTSCWRNWWKKIEKLEGEEFIKEVIHQLPQFSNKCVFSRMFKEFHVFPPGNDILFVASKVEAGDHRCDTLFLTDDINNEKELTMKADYPLCLIYSPSLKYEKEELIGGITKNKMEIRPDGSTIRGNNIKGLSAFILDEIRFHIVAYLYISANAFNFHYLNEFTELGELNNKKIAICQVHLSLPLPSSDFEMDSFRDFLRRTINENRYLLTSITQLDSSFLSIFMLNTDNHYCWGKYTERGVGFLERNPPKFNKNKNK